MLIRVKKNLIDATNDALVKKLQRELVYLKELLQLKRKGQEGQLSIQVVALKEENEKLRQTMKITPA